MEHGRSTLKFRRRGHGAPAPRPRRALVLSGAGLSAESGIPTFRDAGGLWEGHDPAKVADYATWKQNWELVHRFYDARRAAMSTVAPNAAHETLASWQELGEIRHFTQNVDRLLEHAGCADVVHLHGVIDEMRCEACGRVWAIGSAPFLAGEQRCACGSRRGVKPNIVFFGERAPNYPKLWKALDALREDDVFLVVGTSGEVLPVSQIAASMPWTRRIYNGLEPPAGGLDGFDEAFLEPASVALPKIGEMLFGTAQGQDRSASAAP